MKTLLVILTAYAGLLNAQKRVNTFTTVPESLEIGALTVRLNMSKLEVASLLTGGYVLSDNGHVVKDANDILDDRHLSICHVIGNELNCKGGVVFSHGHLSFAVREWNTTEPETLDSLLIAVTNGLGSTSAAATGPACSITNTRRTQPDEQVRIVRIKCGGRMLSIDSSEFTMLKNRVNHIRSIEESIGEPLQSSDTSQ
jgi:hypothetical protein